MRRWRRYLDPPIPEPEAAPAPDLIGHAFEGYRLGDLLICIHLDGTTPCGKGEDEHAPVSGDHGGVAEAGA